MPSPIAQLTPLHPPDPLNLDDIVMLHTAVTRMLEDRDPFTQKHYDRLCGLQDKLKEHASQLAGRSLKTFDLVGWFVLAGVVLIVLHLAFAWWSRRRGNRGA